MNKLARWIEATLSLGPDLNCLATANDRVLWENVQDPLLVVDLSLDLPSTNVLVAAFARVFHQDKLTIRTDLLDTDWSLNNQSNFGLPLQVE